MIDNRKLDEARQIESALLHKLANDIMLGNNPVPEMIGLANPDDFLTCKALITDLYAIAETITTETMFDAYRNHNAVAYLGNLDSVLVGARVVTLCERVRRLSLERSMVSRAQEIIALANANDDVPASMKFAKALELFQYTEKTARFTDANTALENLYQSISSHNGEHSVGIETGYAEFDKHTNGLKPGKLYIVAGSPGMGKTVIGLNWALSAAMLGNDVMYYSLEMSTQDMTTRLMSSICNKTSLEIERSGANADFLGVFSHKKDLFADVFKRVHIRAMENFDDGEEATAMQIVSDFRHLRLSGADPKLVVIDYLGLMEHEESKGNLASAIGKTTRILKKLAGRWKIPVVLLCQVSKDVLKRSDARPVLSDLRDSGHIEQDADLVLFIYRDDHAKGGNGDAAHKGIAELIIAKNRSGVSGIIRMVDKTMFYKLENLR